MAHPGRVYSHLIVGDTLVIGGKFGQPGSIEFRDAAGTPIGTLTDPNFAGLVDSSLTGDTTIGEPGGTPGSLVVFAPVTVHNHGMSFIDGDLLTDPVRVFIDAATGQVGCQSLLIDGINVTELIEAAVRERPVDLDFTTHKVLGHDNAYYIDKGATTHGYNVRVDSVTGLPKIRVLWRGLEMREGEDYVVVRSLSSDLEGPAAVGSHNAIQFTTAQAALFTPTSRVWYLYVRDDQAGA